MNIFNKVTRKTLLKNRTHTIVTIIGIILSAAMITAVTTSTSSLFDYMDNVTKYVNGDWHGVFNSASPDGIEILKSNSQVSNVFVSEDIGYSKLEDPQNPDKPYIFVLGADNDFLKYMPVRLTSGRLPQTENEIIIPAHLAASGTSYNVGDSVTLSLGHRVSIDADGNVGNANERLGQNISYSYSYTEPIVFEKLIENETRTYTIVGIYERPGFESNWAPGYTAITMPTADASQYNIYMRAKNINDTYEIMRQVGINFAYQSLDTNSDLLMFHGISMYSNFLSVVYSFAAILIGLIMFGSISLIGNAFAISVSQRTKQFGLLSSVGATRAQLRTTVLYEALFVSIIGIPIGILSGIAGIGVTLKCLGGTFSALYNGDVPFDLSLSVRPVAIIAAVVICLVTVMISAWIPSRRATRVTAIEAIRQSSDIKIKEKSIRSSKLVAKLFGLPGILAEKHFKRNKKSYRATVISLFMSIVLFVSASAFCDYLTKGVTGVQNYTCDVSWFAYGGSLADNAAADTSARALSDYYSKYAYNVKVSGNLVADNAVLGTLPVYGNAERNGDKATIDFELWFVDDATYLDYLNQNKLDPQKHLYADNPAPVVCNQLTHWDYDQNKYVSYNVFTSGGFDFECSFNGRDDNYEEEGSTSVSLSLSNASLCNNAPWNIGTQRGCVLVFLPMSAIKNEAMHNKIDNCFSYCYLSFMTSNHEKLAEGLNAMTKASGFRSYSLKDYIESQQTARSLILIIKVFSYGFITLISLIAAANVFNTISTNIALRRREFAMLKSVGMSSHGFNKMMNYECLLYGFKALLWGLPASIFVTFLIFLSLMQGFETAFYLPWGAIIIAVLSVFAVVFATMLYSMSKIKKDNPIDALKNENI